MTTQSPLMADKPVQDTTVTGSHASMRSLFGSMLQHGAMYWLATAVGNLSSIFLLPIYTRYLTTTDYGVMELLDLTCSVAVSLLGMRLADSMLFYYFDAKTPRDRATVLGTALIGAYFVGAVLATLGWFSAPFLSGLEFRSPQYAPYLRLVFLSVAFSLPQSLGYTLLRAQNRSGLFLGLSVVRLAFQVTLILWLLMAKHLGFAAMVWTAMITFAIEALLASWYVARGIPISFHWTIFRKLAGYGAPLAIGSVGMLVLHFGDRYVLSRWVTLSAIGNYALGYKIGMLVANFQGAFSQYWSAQVFPLLKRPEGEKIYVRVSTYYTVGLVFVALSLATFSRPLLQIIVTPAYYPAMAFVPVIAVAYVLRALGDYLRTVFFTERRTGYDAAVIASGVTICVILYGILIPRIGAWGAAIATVTAFGAMVPISFWFAQRVKRHSFEWKRIIAGSLCGLGLYTLARILFAWHLGPDFLIAALCCSAFPVVLWAGNFFDASEKIAARQMLSGIILSWRSPREPGRTI
jgi:O-antigen/teichoic acid export membrane protein